MLGNSVKGSGRRGQQQQQQRALGEEENFAVLASVYGKLQVGPSVDPNDQEQEKGRERCLCLPELGCLCLCRLCTCVSVCLARGGGGIHPTTVSCASTLNAGRGLVTASLPCLASTREKGVLQDDIPTAHVIAYLPAWYLIFFPCSV
jgi:hypothetical protein